MSCTCKFRRLQLRSRVDSASAHCKRCFPRESVICGTLRLRFFLGTWNMKGFLNEDRPVQTLRQVLDRLKETYCGPIGYEVRPREV